MAESVTEKVMEKVAEEVAQVVAENASANGTATSTPATTEGMLLAYSSLFIMALIPIYIGAFKSVKYQQAQKESGEAIEVLTNKDAAMFPFIASGALFGLYMVFQIFSKDHVNLLLSFYFLVLGVAAMAQVVSPVLEPLVPSFVPYHVYDLGLKQRASKEGEKDEVLLDLVFSTHRLVVVALCCVVGVWYVATKHWVANNLLGLSFSVNGIELISLSSVMTGTLLLSLLFVYDIFWVFGTDVMVTVARSFDAPIKLVFPQDLLERGLAADKFAMLGLGDIVIPGIFIALLLRFDKSLGRNTHTYFNTCFLSYILGLGLTMLVMHVFKAAQPALLYLVPCCLGLPALLALLKGDLAAYCKYADVIEEENVKEVAQEQAEDEEVSAPVTRAAAKKDQ